MLVPFGYLVPIFIFHISRIKTDLFVYSDETGTVGGDMEL